MLAFLKRVMDQLSDYIQSHLVDYIQKELEHGYSLDSIKRVLLRYHDHDTSQHVIHESRRAQRRRLCRLWMGYYYRFHGRYVLDDRIREYTAC